MSVLKENVKQALAENPWQANLSFIENCMQGLATLKRVHEIEYEYNVREHVFSIDKIKLYHYRPRTKQLNTTPLLVVFATVNRPEILDLFPENSFIGGLLKNGMDVYLLDWGYPDLKDKHITFDCYVNEYLNACVKFIAAKSPEHKINLLGICQGGVICLCYTALAQDIKNLVLISTPIDFHTQDNTVANFLNTINMDALVDVFGNVPGIWLTQFFISLRPFELVGKKYLRFTDNLQNQTLTERFLRVEKWLNDAPDQPGAAFAKLAAEFYKKNKLIKGNILINGQKVDLKKLSVPILNVMASEDEIVPMSASKALKKFIPTEHYTEKVFPSGHIGIYVSDKVGGTMSQAIAEWLKT